MWLKRFLFRYYVWIGLLAATVTVVYFVTSWRSPDRLNVSLSIFAGIAGFIYFVQQQRLAEMQLFKHLFVDFNARYNELNDDLAALAKETSIDEKHEKRVVDYFNLCAEEFFFYKEGYIHPDVWTSWCRGMLQYLDQPQIRAIWDREVMTESYYGLTYEEVGKGAGVR